MLTSAALKEIAQRATKGPFFVRPCVAQEEGVLSFGVDKRGQTDRMVQMPIGDAAFFMQVANHRDLLIAAMEGMEALDEKERAMEAHTNASTYPEDYPDGEFPNFPQDECEALDKALTRFRECLRGQR